MQISGRQKRGVRYRVHQSHRCVIVNDTVLTSRRWTLSRGPRKWYAWSLSQHAARTRKCGVLSRKRRRRQAFPRARPLENARFATLGDIPHLAPARAKKLVKSCFAHFHTDLYFHDKSDLPGASRGY